MKFGWLGDQEHRVFNYRPSYYDEKKDNDKGGDIKKDEKYAPGTYIQGAFRGGNYSVKRPANKLIGIISLIGLILFLVVLILITRFYSLL